MNTRIFVSLLLLVFMIAGCGGSGGQRKKPSDLPPLYPCTLTFTQEGVPVDDAHITLHSDSKWAVGGRTDEKGEVKPVTNGFYDGVPAGMYKITVAKMVIVENEAGDTVKQTEVVDKTFRKKETTPLEIEIVKGNNDQTFDVGKAVSINVPVEH